MSFTWLANGVISDASDVSSEGPGLNLVQLMRTEILQAWTEAEKSLDTSDLLVVLEDEGDAVSMRVGPREEFLNFLQAHESVNLDRAPYTRLQKPASQEGQPAIWVFVPSEKGVAVMRLVYMLGMSKGGDA
jgi:hypothetical protein